MMRVTNNNDFDLIDRFDGQDYLFPKGKTVRCPDQVAAHVFGIGDPDKKPYLVRQGWLRSSSSVDDAIAILDNFAFESIVEKYDEEFALIEQGSSPSAPAEPEDEGAADDVPKSSGTAHKKGNMLKRLQPA
jgi:hypothetical protein